MNSFSKMLTHIFIVVASVFAVRQALQVPFYFSWDMDLTVVQDLMLLRDDQLPTHFAHPGLGMNLILMWASFLAQLFGVITEVKISDIGSSLQPLLLVAEQTSFLRIFNALFCVLLSVLTWKLIMRILSRHANEHHGPVDSRNSHFAFDIWSDSGLGLMTLGLCLRLPALWNYNIFLIRSETFSLGFWVLALFLTLTAIKDVRHHVAENKIYFVGLLAALAFYTKVQSLFLVALIPIVFFLIHEHHSVESAALKFKYKFELMVISFLMILILSVALTYPDYLNPYLETVHPTKFLILLIATFGLIFLSRFQKIQSFLKKRNILPIFEFLKLFFIGWGSAALVALMAPTNIFTSIYNFVFTVRSIFLWSSPLVDVETVFSQITFNQSSWGNLIYLLTFVLVFVLTAKKYWGRWSQNQKISFVGLFVVVCMHVLFAVRDRVQDQIWVQLPLMLVLFLLISNWGRKIQFGLVLWLLVVNTVIFYDIHSKNDKFILGYFDPSVYFHEVYPFGQYEKIFSNRYQTLEQKQQAVRFSENWMYWKNQLRTTFPDMNFSLRDIAPFENGMIVRLSQSVLRWQMNPHLVFSILSLKNQTQLELSEKCVFDRAVPTTINEKKMNQIFLRSVLQDPQTQRLLPAVCEIRNLSADDAIVVVSAY